MVVFCDIDAKKTLLTTTGLYTIYLFYKESQDKNIIIDCACGDGVTTLSDINFLNISKDAKLSIMILGLSMMNEKTKNNYIVKMEDDIEPDQASEIYKSTPLKQNRIKYFVGKIKIPDFMKRENNIDK